MKNNKITVRFSDEEMEAIEKRANVKDMKVATLIHEATINSITNDELLSNKDELKQFIIETVEQANDKKLGRIISLLFRALSHIDVVKEQNDIFYRAVNMYYEFPLCEQYYMKFRGLPIRHPITTVAEKVIEERDKENIINYN